MPHLSTHALLFTLLFFMTLSVNGNAIPETSHCNKNDAGRSPFCLLKDSRRYTPCTFPVDASDRPEVWTRIFRDSIPSFRDRAAAQNLEAAHRFASSYERILAELDRGRKSGQEHGLNALDALTHCRLREELLRAAGLDDVFATVKHEENRKALRLLPDVLAALGMPNVDEARSQDNDVTDRERLLRTVYGIFAGNMFDLGAASSAKRFDEKNAGKGDEFDPESELDDFLGTCAALRRRPLLIGQQDLERFVDKAVSTSSHWPKKTLIFVDNAGADVILGVLPFALELLRLNEGSKVVLCANHRPAINDVTADELRALMTNHISGDPDRAHQGGQVASALLEAAVSSGQLRVVSTGSDLPVLDLRQVSQELNEAAAGADLVIFEGMGRGIETNLFTGRLSVDQLNIGTVKHREVAELLGREDGLYGGVFRFESCDVID